MIMDNEHDQSKVAYEDGPKEVNKHRRMPDGDKQFGKESKTMPQDSKPATKAYVKKALEKHNELYHHGQKPYHKRHKEHR
jgi:hypothetical protein